MEEEEEAKIYVAHENGVSNKRTSNEHFLSEDVVFQILVWLPTVVLYNCMSYVCRKWYDIIRNPLFIKERLLRSKPGFLFHFHCKDHLPSVVNLGESDVDLTEFNFGHPRMVVASCDGLVLLKHSDRDLYVANLLTKKTLHLPTFHEPLRSGRSNFSLVYDCSRSSYRVFTSYYPEGSITVRCAIITVGGDRSWAFVASPKICPNIYRIHTLRAGSIVYWCSERTFPGLTRRNFSQSYRVLLAFDVESETFHRAHSPELDFNKQECFYLEREKSLTFLVRVKLENVFDVWMMSYACDGTRGFMWKKKFKFDLGSPAISGDHMYSPRVPVAWANNGETVIFCTGNGCFTAYNVKTASSFEFGRECGSGTKLLGFFSEFSYSLVWFSSPC